MKVYVMSPTVYTRLKRRYGEVRCFVCGKEIHVGDRVASVYHYYGKRKTKVSHLNCYRKLWVGEEEDEGESDKLVH